MSTGLELGNFKKFGNRVRVDRFRRLLEHNVASAMRAVGNLAEDKVRADIRKGKWKSNAAMTLALKPGVSTPLRGSSPSALMQAIESKFTSWDKSIVGVLRDKTVPGRDGKQDRIMLIAMALHKGFTIKVTEKMRRFLAAIGRPIGSGTRRLRVPARPFLRSATSKAMRRHYTKEWNRATQAALSGKRV